MIETKLVSEELIDWKSADAFGQRVWWLGTLRKFLSELDALNNPAVDDIFNRWKLFFNNIDAVPRIDLTDPQWPTPQ